MEKPPPLLEPLVACSPMVGGAGRSDLLLLRTQLLGEHLPS